MLSLTCKTAIKAVVFLATRSGETEKPGIKAIANGIGASEHTVGKLLQELVRATVINSIKGPNGGFFITEKQQQLPIINIIEAIDGNTVFEACGLGLSTCSAKHPCPLHEQYMVVRNNFRDLCLHNRISNLCENVTGGIAYLIG